MTEWKIGDITHINHLIGFNQLKLFLEFNFYELDLIFDFMSMDFEEK